MRFDLTEPCENCPFRSDDNRIRFGDRERAEEIEEAAYRKGFPCHVSAKYEEDEESGDGGYVFGEDTQHCAGYILMELRDGGHSGWPGIGNDEELAERLATKMNWNAPVFQNADEFLAANTRQRWTETRRPDVPATAGINPAR